MATPEWVRKEVRKNFAKATREGCRQLRTQPHAASASYLARARALEVNLTNGVTLIIPVKLIPALERASARQLSEVEVLGAGGGLHWESLDIDLSVLGLVSSLFDTSTWMAELGRRGGRSASAAKARAARMNGRKGGRPRLHERRGGERAGR